MGKTRRHTKKTKRKTRKTKKPCKRNRTTLKRSFKKRGGEGSNDRSNVSKHSYAELSTPPYARLHGKSKQNNISTEYNKLHNTGINSLSLLNNRIARIKKEEEDAKIARIKKEEEMKLKGWVDNNKKGWFKKLRNKKKPVKPMDICIEIKNAKTKEQFENIRNNLNQLEIQRTRTGHTHVPLIQKTDNTSVEPLYNDFQNNKIPPAPEPIYEIPVPVPVDYTSNSKSSNYRE